MNLSNLELITTGFVFVILATFFGLRTSLQGFPGPLPLVIKVNITDIRSEAGNVH